MKTSSQPKGQISKSILIKSVKYGNQPQPEQPQASKEILTSKESRKSISTNSSRKTNQKITFNENSKTIIFEISKEEQFYSIQYDIIIDHMNESSEASKCKFVELFVNWEDYGYKETNGSLKIQKSNTSCCIVF